MSAQPIDIITAATHECDENYNKAFSIGIAIVNCNLVDGSRELPNVTTLIQRRHPSATRLTS